MFSKKVFMVALFAFFAVALVSCSEAITVGFEDMSDGYYQSLPFYEDGITVDMFAQANQSFRVVDVSSLPSYYPGCPVDGKALWTRGSLLSMDVEYDSSSYYAYSFEMLVGDFGQDADLISLDIYDTDGELLKTISASLPSMPDDTGTWTFMADSVDSPIGGFLLSSSGTYPNTLYVDNFRMPIELPDNTQVPEPMSLILLGIGLLGVGARRRK